MATLQFCSELDKVWSEMHACWPWQNAIDTFVFCWYICILHPRQDPCQHYCSWLHRLELLRQAQGKDGNSGH